MAEALGGGTRGRVEVAVRVRPPEPLEASVSSWRTEGRLRFSATVPISATVPSLLSLVTGIGATLRPFDYRQ